MRTLLPTGSGMGGRSSWVSRELQRQGKSSWSRAEARRAQSLVASTSAFALGYRHWEMGKAFLAEVTESRRERRGFRRRTGGRRCAGRDTPRGSEVLGAGDPTIPAGTRGEQGYVGSHDNSITPGARGALRAWSIAGALPRPRALRARKLFRETASQPRGGGNATTSARKLCASVPPRETRVFQTIAQPIRVRGITPP